MTLSAPASRLLVPPRYATPRDPSRRTLGGSVARVAELLGRPAMPWQRLAADVGGEVDDVGRPVYPLVVVSVPRQAGKTTLDLATSVQRCLYREAQFVWHTAQSGQDARAKWGELVEDVQRSPLSELVRGRPRRTNGAEALTFVNGSVLRPHPPTRDALHGRQSDLNNIDEGWSFTEAEGADLMQAITPTQLTRPGAQTWVWSTMGDASSTWFHDLVERGRAGEPGICLIDYGVPDDIDASEITAEVAAQYHPATGYTVSLESLQAAEVSMRKRPGEYARAYGNKRTGGRERVIPAGPWGDAGTEDELPPGRPAYGLAVYEPRDGGDVSGAIVAAVVDADGIPWVEVIEHRPGRAWLVDRVRALADVGQGIAVDRRGPAGPVADALELEGFALFTPNGTEAANACQDLWDRMCDREALAAGPRWRYRADEYLDIAAEVAGRRWIGTGAWVWDDERSTGDTAPLKAATLATWVAARVAEPLTVGRSVFG